MPSRRTAAVPLPKNVFRVKRRHGFNYYWQLRRGRPDASKIERLPDDPRDPEFWRIAKALNDGEKPDAGPKAGSFSALIKYYKEDAARYKKLAESSKEIYDICLDRIDAAWGGLPVADIMPTDIYALQNTYADRPTMGNMIVRVLRTLLKEGIRANYTQVNAAREIEELDADVVGSEPWPEPVYAYVLEHAPTLIMRTAVLGRATGQRCVDLVKLRPVDRDGEGFKMDIQKVKERHWTPCQAEALAIIDGWNQEPMVPYLNLSRKRISEDYLRQIFREWRKEHAARIPDDITLHDLRAAAVCDRRIGGVAHQQIADQLCMSLQMVIRYSKKIDKAENARAGMKVLERSENESLKHVYDKAETRGK